MTNSAIKQKVFENKAVVTKGYVKERLDYKQYSEVKKYFDGLEPVPGTRGKKFLTDDVISKMRELRVYED